MCIYHISSCYTGMYNLKKQQPLVLKLDDNIKQQMIWQACYKSDNFVIEKLWHVKENIELSPFNNVIY